MKREIREAAVCAAVSLAVGLLAGRYFWLHQTVPGALLLGTSWGFLSANAFLLGARYGINRVFDRIREDPPAPERWRAPGSALRCPGCGCTEFTGIAGAQICICCGAVLAGAGEAGRREKSKV